MTHLKNRRKEMEETQSYISDKSDVEIEEMTDLIKGHLDEHYNKLGEIVGIEITDELKSCIQSIIVRTNQYTELNLEYVKRQLHKSFDELPSEMKEKINNNYQGEKKK